MKKKMVINAPIAKRLLAFIIDLAIIDLIVAISFQGLLRNLVPATSIAQTYKAVTMGPPKGMYAILLSAGLIAFLYFYIIEGKTGQSIGKRIMRVKVVSQKDSAWGHILRNLFIIPFMPFILLWIIDPVFMLLNEDNQRLTEYLGKTKVVEEISW
ncbi:MAG: RDD family protein [Candidatus Woesearchaeota archaeon]